MIQIPDSELGVGFYRPTRQFRDELEHIAVMHNQTSALIALTGSSGNFESLHKSIAEAILYAHAQPLLALAKYAASGNCTSAELQEAAQKIIHAMQHDHRDWHSGAVNTEHVTNAAIAHLGLSEAFCS